MKKYKRAIRETKINKKKRGQTKNITRMKIQI